MLCSLREYRREGTMKQFIKFSLALGMTTGFAVSAMAGGFQIGEMATRASGMGSAFTAVSDDASAAWHPVP